MVMERLTNKAWRNFKPWEYCDQGNFCARECNEDGGCNNGCIVPKLYSRLASIEEILGDEYDLDHLRNLLQAEKSGQLVVLPCKVGDTVYGHNKTEVSEYKVSVISLATYNWYLRCQNQNSDFWVTDADIGRTVFLTREEAEAALKGGEG